ncbi:hypothetical protein ACLKA7_007591 [Drosophila subpalustris]
MPDNNLKDIDPPTTSRNALLNESVENTVERYLKKILQEKGDELLKLGDNSRVMTDQTIAPEYAGRLRETLGQVTDNQAYNEASVYDEIYANAYAQYMDEQNYLGEMEEQGMFELPFETDTTPNDDTPKPECTVINNQHVPEFEEILPGTLMLNGFNGFVTLDEKTLQLQGTFIIQYRNATVKIGDRIYKTEEIRPAEPEPPLFQLEGETTKLDEVLSLQMINELNINNTKTLEKLGDKETIQATLSYTSLSILLILIVGLAIELIRRIREAATEKKRAGDDNTPNNKTPIGIYIATEDDRI